jgi:uncharacterized membrane protein
MAHIEKSIEVSVPIRTAYNQWTQFEEFPKFMEGVKRVRQLDDKNLEWQAEIAGKDVQWTATITQQEPDRRIGWRSTSGATNAGSVTFEPVGPNQTKITLRLEYEPETFGEKAASAVGIVSARVTGDLERFKKFIEARGVESGAWRGQIKSGQVTRPDQAGAGM